MMVTNKKMLLFWGGVFSQWYSNSNYSHLFYENGLGFYTAEHYMMYHKARLFKDNRVMEECLKPHSPEKVKVLGREIKGFNDSNWDKYKLDIVEEGNYLKFSQNTDLYLVMMKYKHLTLVEASPYDKIWGIGLAEDNPDALNTDKWKGQNLLGKALMNARKRIISLEKISMNKEFKEDILNGYKNQTIRRGMKRGFKIGESLIEFEDLSKVLVEVKEIIYKRYKDLTNVDAIKDGFRNLEELQKKLLEIYGPIKDKETITLVKFSIIGNSN